ncbi:TPA: glutamate-5-semialdehyde dehydrogenase [archaeon]|nr:glutamate-5-semialdehyde dehydrogenase [Candidatus Naiadarchaeales archaeon SRR2090159.bin1288]
MEAIEKAKLAKDASRKLAILTDKERNEALSAMADALEKHSKEILEGNKKDASSPKAKHIDRLMLNEQRIKGMADGLRDVSKLKSPVGETVKEWVQKDGLKIKEIRVPLGVVGIIYEARPNVTADVAGLCIKSGNSAVLKGGSDAINSNIAIVKILREALKKTKASPDAIQLIEDREAVNDLLKARGLVDVIIPRGGAELIKFVVENSRIPVIETGAGVCHVYVDEFGDLNKAVPIIINAKTQRPTVCNAIDTLLVSKKIAKELLPKLHKEMPQVELRGDEEARKILPDIRAATEKDWDTEHLGLTLGVKVVPSIDEAINHIETHGTHHSDAIITENKGHAQKFTKEIDSACVYVNASTRFSDGGEFGFGAEVGISTQKLHARGPMGLEALTSIKYIVEGSGQVRK